MRKLIYTLKELIHKRPRLYSLIYSALTFNMDYFKQRLRRGLYPSRFGGMWTDSKNFDQALSRLHKQGDISDQEHQQLTKWHTQGFTVLEKAIPEADIDAYIKEVEAFAKEPGSPLLVTSAAFPRPALYKKHSPQRPYGRTPC